MNLTVNNTNATSIINGYDALGRATRMKPNAKESKKTAGDFFQIKVDLPVEEAIRSQ